MELNNSNAASAFFYLFTFLPFYFFTFKMSFYFFTFKASHPSALTM